MAERRNLTILFCDLVGWTSLSELLDPEELGEIQGRYERFCASCIGQLGGAVVSLAGDGVMACFGYPVAHENDAERAVRAGLAIIAGMERLDRQLEGTECPPLAVRIGIQTGLVVVDSRGVGVQQTSRIVGEAANLAARLQAEARPGSVLVTQETLDLTAGLFDVRPEGLRRIKGLSRLVSVYEILASSPVPDRMARRLEHGAAIMVGREREVGALAEHWAAVRAQGCGRIVHVVGEAGIGKSRLLAEFRRAQVAPDANFLQLHCLELFRTTPLYPVISLVQARAGFGAADDDPARLRRLEAYLAAFGLGGEEETAALIAQLLGLAGAEARLRPLGLTPLQLKKRQFEVLGRLLEKDARSGPTVICIEDAHWIDPSTAELLALGTEQAAALPVLWLITFRPSCETALREPLAAVRLRPLASDGCRTLARSVPGAQELGEDLLERVLDVADGLPLFVEQLTIGALQQMREERAEAARSGRRAATRSSVPLSLAELIAERLDRLPEGRGALQAAAALGKPFTADLLATILDRPAEDVLGTLQVLLEADILRLALPACDGSYEFRHVLLQRAAYEAMVQRDRRAVHARIAGVLRQHLALAGELPPELVAHHLTAAELIDDAVPAWIDAGRQAVRRSANIEAIAHLRRALELTTRLPDPATRARHETTIHVTLIGPLVATRGFCAPEVAQTCQRGLALCGGEPSPLVFPFLNAQVNWSLSGSRMPETLTLAERFLALAEGSGYEPGRVIGYRLKGASLLASGRAAEARRALETSIRLYEPTRDESVTYLFGQHSRITSQAILSLTLYFLGEVEEAVALGWDTLSAADGLRHPLSTALAVGYVGGWVFGFCGAMRAMQAQAKRLVAVSEQHDLPVFRAFGRGFLGWALCSEGRLDEGARLIEGALVDFDAAGFQLSVPHLVAILADARRRTGQIEEALALCARARRMIDDRGEHWCEPEVRRVEALVASAMHPDEPERAAAMLRDAVACARLYGSPSFELRCLRSLLELPGVEPVDGGAVLGRYGELSRRLPSEAATAAIIGRLGASATARVAQAGRL